MVRAAVSKTEERMRQYLRQPPTVPPSASSHGSVASASTMGARSIQDTSSRLGAWARACARLSKRHEAHTHAQRANTSISHSFPPFFLPTPHYH